MMASSGSILLDKEDHFAIKAILEVIVECLGLRNLPALLNKA
jgi:hypothetical protein